MKPQAKKEGGSVKKMAGGGLRDLTPQEKDKYRHDLNLEGGGEEWSSRGFGTKNALRNFRSAVTGQRPKPLGTQVSPRKLREQQKADDFMDRSVDITTCGPLQTDYAKGGTVKDSKMSKKVAGYFAKKGNKALAAHEYREAAGKEEDTPAIAKREMQVLKGAPADMKNYEAKEHKAMGMKNGGMPGRVMKNGPMHRTGDKGDGMARKGKTGAELVKMNCGGGMKGYAKGGKIDGIASKGKTNCKYR